MEYTHFGDLIFEWKHIFLISNWAFVLTWFIPNFHSCEHGTLRYIIFYKIPHAPELMAYPVFKKNKQFAWISLNIKIYNWGISVRNTALKLKCDVPNLFPLQACIFHDLTSSLCETCVWFLIHKSFLAKKIILTDTAYPNCCFWSVCKAFLLFQKPIYFLAAVQFLLYSATWIILFLTMGERTSYPMGTGGVFPGDKSDQGVKLITHLQLVPRSRKHGSIHVLPHTPSWGSA
jgi:hypothetical protein